MGFSTRVHKILNGSLKTIKVTKFNAHRLSNTIGRVYSLRIKTLSGKIAKAEKKVKTSKTPKKAKKILEGLRKSKISTMKISARLEEADKAFKNSSDEERDMKL